MRPVLLHVGYHKTGTTWLQRTVFTAATFSLPAPRGRVAHDFATANPFEFDAAVLAADYEARLAADPGVGFPVISLERLSGNPHSGGYDSRTIADRLASVFPAARILIVIREQRTMLASMYKEYVRMGGPMTFRQYTSLPRGGRDRVPLFRMEFLQYDRMIGHYIDRFSPGSVLVLPYELLSADPVEFVRRIADHVEVEPPPVRPRREHSSASALACALKRPINRFVVRDALNPAGLLNDRRANAAVRRVTDRVAATLAPLERGYERRFVAAVDAVVRDRYQESNATTAKLTGLDLERWGYDIAP